MNKMWDWDRNMLALVAKHPTLYDHTMPKYKFTDVKQAIWEEITRTVLGKDDRKTVQKVKLRWKGIRDCYVKWSRVKSQGNGKLRPYKYNDELSFLDPFLQVNKKSDETNSDCDDDGEVSMVDPLMLMDTSTSSIPDQNNRKRRFSGDNDVTSEPVPKMGDFQPDFADPIEVFFYSIAQTVKKLRPLTVARVKKQIVNIVMDEEIKELEKNN